MGHSRREFLKRTVKTRAGVIINILIVGMSLGTAWAVRGQFGHEQGAAWAGAIGSLALIIVSDRPAWFRKAFPVMLASAAGWGAGGMISYGRVVGYGRSDNLLNAFYGLLMLFVIGGLFGLLGGGLTGLSLESTRENKVKWGSLITEMVAVGLIIYGFLVMQLEIKMTPPRSEAWAFCLGAGIALLWYMARNQFKSSLRVAIITGMGAGFGFAFGNFLQILGNVLEVRFNMWNVMEYSIGFFGGSALAYGVFSSKWPVNVEEPRKWENRVSVLVTLALIPLIVYLESIRFENLLNRLSQFGAYTSVAAGSSIVAAIVIVVMFLFVWGYLRKTGFLTDQRQVLTTFVIYFSVYIFISFIVSGLFAGNFPLNHLLYIVNLILVLILSKKKRLPFEKSFTNQETNLLKNWPYLLILLVVVIFILATISVSIHGEMGGAYDRFPVY